MVDIKFNKSLQDIRITKYNTGTTANGLSETYTNAINRWIKKTRMINGMW